MAVTFPYVRAATWADGSTTDTAAKRNTIEDGIFNAHQQPAVRVFHNTTQSVTSGADLSVAFNSERFDTAGGAASTQHDTVTNNSRLTCLYAGKYLISATVAWAVSPANSAVYFRLNGATEIARCNFPASDARAVNLTTIYDLAVNDYVELRVGQASGGAVNLASSGNSYPEFMMVRVA